MKPYPSGFPLIPSLCKVNQLQAANSNFILSIISVSFPADIAGVCSVCLAQLFTQLYCVDYFSWSHLYCYSQHNCSPVGVDGPSGVFPTVQTSKEKT